MAGDCVQNKKVTAGTGVDAPKESPRAPAHGQAPHETVAGGEVEQGLKSIVKDGADRTK